MADPEEAPSEEMAETLEGGNAETFEEGGVAQEGMVAEEVVYTDEFIEQEDLRLVTENITNEGAIGFHHIASAAQGDPLVFRAAFLGEFFNADSTVRFEDTNTRTIGRVLIQGTLLEYFSINAGLAARSNVNSFGQPEAMLSLGDANLGATLYYPVTEFMTLAGDLGLFMPASFGESGLALDATSVRPRLLATLDARPLTDGAFPVKTHINLGYRFDNSSNAIPEASDGDPIDVTRIERFAYGLSAYDALEFGVGAEYELPYVTPFLGFFMGLPVNGDDDICDTGALPCASEVGAGAAAPKVLSLGLKAEPISTLGLHAGVDFGLTTQAAQGVPATAPYNIVLGLSWTIDPRPQVEYVEIEKVIEKVIEKERVVEEDTAKGFLLGAVVDGENTESVKGAVIEYVGEEVSSQVSSSINGKFRSYGFAPGTQVTLRVTHPDYKPAEVDATVTEGEVPLSIELDPLPKVGTLGGRVFDENDAPIKIAKVFIVGNGADTSVPVDAAGKFSRDLKAGAYSVRVQADGYLTGGRDIVVEPNEKVSLDLVLLAEPAKSVVVLRDEKIEIQEKIFFETGEATLLPRSFNLLNQVAALLLENPQVKTIRIEGHTDDRGEDDFNLDLSQRRAEAVRTYLLDRGISASRLESKGYGSSRPILPNTSNRNRDLNRRVEFTITSQDAAQPKN